jgi:ligand-binding sensor domain-containing protein
VDGLVDDRVHALFASGQSMWVGTEGGVSSFDGETWTSFTKADGLAEDFTQVIAQDRHGHMWFGSRCGISRRLFRE